MLKDVGIEVTKQGQSAACMQRDDSMNMRNPLLVFADVGIWGYARYDCCMLSSAALCPCFSTFWHFNPYIYQHFSENVFTLVSLVFTVCVKYKPTDFRRAEFYLLCIP